MSTTISGDTGVDKATNQAVKNAMGVTGIAPIFGCRAWVNFDGTRNEADTGASVIGQNVKIRASGNVSSVVKNGVGDYIVNFTTSMPDVNYSINVNSRFNTTDDNYSAHISRGNLPSVNNCTVSTLTSSTSNRVDHQYISVLIFR